MIHAIESGISSVDSAHHGTQPNRDSFAKCVTCCDIMTTKSASYSIPTHNTHARRQHLQWSYTDVDLIIIMSRPITSPTFVKIIMQVLSLGSDHGIPIGPSFSVMITGRKIKGLILQTRLYPSSPHQLRYSVTNVLYQRRSYHRRH